MSEDPLDRYARVKKAAERARRDADLAQGRYDAALARLKEETGYSTPEDAEAYLVGLREEEQQISLELAAGLAAFEAEWGKKLGGG